MESEKELCCVLTRGLPVEGRLTDKVVHTLQPDETIKELWKWVELQTRDTVVVRVEIVEVK